MIVFMNIIRFYDLKYMNQINLKRQLICSRMHTLTRYVALPWLRCHFPASLVAKTLQARKSHCLEGSHAGGADVMKQPFRADVGRCWTFVGNNKN